MTCREFIENYNVETPADINSTDLDRPTLNVLTDKFAFKIPTGVRRKKCKNNYHFKSAIF